MDNKFQDIHYLDRYNEEHVIRGVMIQSIYFENRWIKITYRKSDVALSNFYVFIPIIRGFKLVID